METLKQFIQDNNITMTAEPITARTDTCADNFDKTAFHFLCTLNSGERSMSVPFSCGEGIALSWLKDQIKAGKVPLRNFRGTKAEILEACHCVAFKRLSVHEARLRNACKEYARKHYSPDLESVLDCLASDYSGYINSRAFEDWASEYGYDTDSRKAEKVYMAVREQSLALENLLGREACNKLAFDVERL